MPTYPTIPPFIPTGPADDGLPGQIVWDRECIYTFDGVHWGRTPRAVSSGAWDDLSTAEGGPSVRFLLASGPQSLSGAEKRQAQVNLGLLPATTESFGLVRYTDSWQDNGSGDPGDYPVTLTRHAIMALIGNKLVAGTSNVSVSYDETSGNTTLSVTGGGGGSFDGHLDADLVIGHGVSGTRAEWTLPLGDVRHEGRIDETVTGYSVFVGVDPSHTADDLVDAINNQSSLGFIVEAVKVSESALKLVARQPGTSPNAYVFTASARQGVTDPCFGTGTLTRSVNGTTTAPASTYTATLNGSRMLSEADVDDKPVIYSKNPIGSGAVYSALRNPPAAVPEGAPLDNILRNGHRYLLASASSLDLSSMEVEVYGSVELWVDVHAGASVTWPDWSWIDGNAPSSDTVSNNTRYAAEAVNDGRAVVAKLKYTYEYA